MQITKPRSRILAATLVGLVALGATNSAHAYSVYRSVTADAGTRIVVWTLANFGVSGPAPTLSFRYYANDIAAKMAQENWNTQCFVKVDLGNLPNPQVHDVVAVGNVNIPVNAPPGDNPTDFPWDITFDNNPVGHWSIAKAEIQDPLSTNAAASRVAAAGFQSLATTDGSGVTVVSGHLPDCRAQ